MQWAATAPGDQLQNFASALVRVTDRHINPNMHVLMVGGNQEKMQTHRKVLDLNPGPSCYEAAVLTTEQPCCL